MAPTKHAILDVVEPRAATGRWPGGTAGTVIEADVERALVEISNDRGHALDFIFLPHDALAPRPTESVQWAASQRR